MGGDSRRALITAGSYFVGCRASRGYTAGMRGLPLLGIGLVCAASSAVAQDAAARCSALASLKLDHASITSASLISKGQGLGSTRLKPERASTLKDLCRVQILDQPSNDSHILTEVWLPAAGWNGRYDATGNGGFAGEIYFEQMAAAVDQGYVTSGTDTGHVGPAASFALGHPEQVKDFGWRAIHDMSVLAKQVAQAFYGKSVSHSYLAACSDGGREALIEAQRFPTDFDGILAGAPAYNWTGLLASGSVNEAALHASAASYVPARKLPALAAAVRNACDSLDGVKDGILNDPQDCRFDPASMICKAGDTDSCLLPEQVASLKVIFGAKKDAAGNVVFPGISRGAEDAQGGVAGWVVGDAPSSTTLIGFFSTGFFSNMVFEKPDWSIQSFDFDRDLAAAKAKTADALNATDTNLKPFIDRGGKLILYHGWNDPAIPALSTVAYYDGLVSRMGAGAVDASVKLYMVPGMLHCDGGPGAVSIGQSSDHVHGDAQHDLVTALEQWVEQGRGPGTVIATGNGMTRPLCVFPAKAKYVNGDTKDAKSFTCAR